MMDVSRAVLIDDATKVEIIGVLSRGTKEKHGCAMLLETFDEVLKTLPEELTPIGRYRRPSVAETPDGRLLLRQRRPAFDII